MGTRKIHCPICHGTGKTSDPRHGYIACLNCVGSGIVDLDSEQQMIISNIAEQKGKEEIDARRKEQERLRLLKENEKQQSSIQQEEKESNYTGLIIGLLITAIVIFVIYYFWDEITNFFWELIKGIFMIFLVIGVGAVMISMASND